MQSFSLLLKGFAMGAANVIPGVSGGTIAFITGIYERLIKALKSINATAIKLFFTGKWNSFAKYIDFKFLFWLFLGVGLSILSLAKLLEWALLEQEVLTMAFFFGLIVASVIGVGRQLEEINITVIVGFVVGCSVAVAIAFLPPATQNDSFVYLIICGIVAVSSMILPGLSGSYILLLMGNYALVLGAISRFYFGILLPVAVGVVIGLVLFSRLLDWLFENFKVVTISILTGFVAGSLLIIWPWKIGIMETFEGKEKIISYEWFLPSIDQTFFIALGLSIVGFMIVWLMDRNQADRL